MKKPKFLNNKDAWMLAEDIPNVDPFFIEVAFSCFANEQANACGRNYQKVLAVWHSKFNNYFYYGQKDCLAMEKYLVNKIVKNPKFGQSINSNIIKNSDQLRRFCQKLNRLELSNLSNEKLADIFDQTDLLHTKLYEWCWLSNATDMFHNTFTQTLKDYLKTKIKNQVEFNQIFSILTSPEKKSVAAKQEESLLKIADLIKNHQSYTTQLKEHYQKYFYLKYLWLGKTGVYNYNYFYREALKLSRKKDQPSKLIKILNSNLIKIKKDKSRLFQELKFDKKFVELFQIYSDFMLTKIYRRYDQIYLSYCLSHFLKLAAKKLNISFDEIRYLTAKELSLALRQGDLNKNELKKRLDFFWIYVEKDLEIFSTDKNHPWLNFLKQTKKVFANELTGQIGCLGKAKGFVKIINSPSDINKMKKGDILVSIATNPDLVPAMKKAAAIVTEQGGVTSHAAIISREMNIPCVIGTKIATQVFKDGDWVEVDANIGIIKKL